MHAAERVRLFISKAKDLETRSLYKNPAFFTTVDLPEMPSADLTDVFVNKLPDEEEALALLVCFRPFILKGEPVFLDDFCRLAERAINCKRSRAVIQASQRKLKQLRKEWPITMHWKGKNLKAEQALDLWMYGYVFHAQKGDKVRFFHEMPSGMRDALKIQALHYMLAVTVEIARVRRLLQRAIRRRLLDELVTGS